ncbi:MAG: nuclear transport factor 2 family protein [Novosphingobium sp.]|jgi:hypothetical protein|uniref:nuclear transport factor 2 family protein n=1 Tax=Novosphingobium sp. TaxID=1874826 RepID=UPI0022CC2418|nr:nuclear transport factor 2 family protein [Novosphingobium sp.]MCE2841229.1 nuclear transport factor 2 family protein [Novosphingobium sp.]MCE2841631.1 nuclear transport factor 2 family protein [Novosphingobium sp.]MCZ8018467.1 nuclear transport factor 2 family protein [Novosphingobium sp.]MCZ8033461.1 nuclear transport factor 2 family protein [Novosphingobium sp.]MCZ8051916.1 nuclear transport factor 2 family protein [Novosphingobium sp.]
MSDAALLARVEALEGERAIRQLVARYFRICDDLGPDTPFAELGELFTPNAIWEGKGRYAKAFGRYDGREAIVEMIRSYCLPKPHFAMTAHFLTAENISLHGAEGTGEWMMLQTSDYNDGRADLRSAHLTIQCQNDGGIWRISHFRTLNLFSRRVERWSDVAEIPVPQPSQTDPPA